MVKDGSKGSEQQQSGGDKAPVIINADAARTGGVELRSNYSISSTNKILGAGAFGKVFHSTNIADPTLEVAIKLFNKTKLTPE